MMISRRNWFWKLGIVSLLGMSGAFASSVYCAQAQITPDTTLNTQSVVTPNLVIRGLPSDRIDGGAIRGSNLFHSFQEFNVGAGRGVYFTNPTGIDNILSRVTGSNPSNILGRLGILGNANLFLINPNGIVFGSSASLDIKGSFVATTANAIKLGDTGLFSASELAKSDLLAVNPGTLFFNAVANQQGVISNAGNLSAGQNLTLAADNLYLQGQLQAGNNLTLRSRDTLQIRDSITNPLIAWAGKEMLVQGNQIDILALNHPESGFFSGGDMVLRSPNPVIGDAHYWTGGSFRIEQLDGSLGNLSSLYDPIIRSSGDVSFINYQGTSLHILAGGSVNIGSVNITGTDLVGNTVNPTATPTLANVTLSDGSSIVINGNAQPTFDVRAGMKPGAIGSPLGTQGYLFPRDIFFNSSFFLTLPPTNNLTVTSADITIREIVVSAPNGVVFLTNQFQPNLSLPGGNIQVTANSLLLGSLGAGIAANTLSPGKGLSVTIDARSNINLFGSTINGTLSGGNGGDVTLLAKGDITTGAINSTSLAGSPFKGGAIALNAFGNITTNDVLTNGGNIALTSRNGKIDTTGGTLNSSSAMVDGGAIALDAPNDITTASINSSGNLGGKINLTTNGIFSTVNNSQIVSESSSSNPAVMGGNIDVKAKSVNLNNGSQIIASTIGAAPGGNLTVAAESVTLTGTNATGTTPSGLATSTDGSGTGGKLTITTGQLRVIDGAKVRAINSSSGAGGALSVNASEFVEVNGTAAVGSLSSGILTQATPGSTGNTGDMIITTGKLIVGNGAQVSASTFSSGRSGNLTVNASESVEVSGTNTTGTTASGLFANTVGVGSGNAGRLTIATKRLSVREGAQVGAGTFGSGDGGTLEVIASESVEVSGRGAFGSKAASALFTAATSKSTGNGGDLKISTRQLSIRDGAEVSASTFGIGNSRNLIVNASESVEVSGAGSSLSAEAGAAGDGGNLAIATRNLTVNGGAQVSVSTFSSGRSGNLTVDASQSVDVSGTDATGTVASGLLANTFSSGNAGKLAIATKQFTICEGAQVGAGTFGSGNGGVLEVIASESLEVSGRSAFGKNVASSLFTSADLSTTGAAGDLKIATNNLIVQNGANVSTSTNGTGRGGTLSAIATNYTELSGGGGLFTNTTNAGNAGNLTLATEQLIVRDGSKISASTSGGGTAGNISLRVNNSANISGTNSGLFTNTNSSGKGGDITIDGNAVRVADGAVLNAEASNIGDGGKIQVNANTLEVDSARLSSSTSGKGSAGNIDLKLSDRLQVSGNGVISTSTSSTGQGGRLSVSAGNSVELKQGSRLLTETQGAGDAGNLAIATNNLTIQDGAQASASTSGIGRGGEIQIQSNTLSLTNNGRLTSRSQAEGNAGNIQLNIPNYIAISGVDNSGNSSGVFTSSSGTGNGGNITANTNNFQISNSGVLNAATSNSGQGGAIAVNANTFKATSGGQLLATTAESGRAGDISIKATNSTIEASALRTSTAAKSTGDGGNINIDTTNLNITAGGVVSAQSEGTGSAGNITINASQTLNANKGTFTAQADRAGGGDIKIFASDVRLNNSSLISTSVANSTGGGGDITIKSNTFIALEDSDILANANAGPGGNITINSPVFLADLFSSGKATPVGRNPGDFARFRGNDRVDISASSQVGISGSINIPDFTFLQSSLSQLASNFVNADRIVSGSCLARRNAERGSFTVTGTGGLPATPFDRLSSRYNVARVQPLEGERGRGGERERGREGEGGSGKMWKLGDRIQEAQGMSVTADGRIVVGTDPQLVAMRFAAAYGIANAKEMVCQANFDE